MFNKKILLTLTLALCLMSFSFVFAANGNGAGMANSSSTAGANTVSGSADRTMNNVGNTAGNVVRDAAEGIGGVANLAKIIEEKTGVERRASVLGHVQRGGSPSLRDRLVASEMGNYAVHLLMKGASNRVVAMQKEEVMDFDIYEALNMKNTINLDLYRIAHEISI